jgi:hypothetical protein
MKAPKKIGKAPSQGKPSKAPPPQSGETHGFTPPHKGKGGKRSNRMNARGR